MFDLSHRQQKGREIDLFSVGSRLAARRIAGQGPQQIAASIRRQGFGQSLFVRQDHARLIDIQHARIIEAPLDDVDRVEHRGFGGGLVDLHDALFATPEGNRAEGVAQGDLAVDEREHRAAIVSNGKAELGSAHRARGQRGLELQLGRFLAIEKVEGTGFEIQQLAFGGLIGQPDFKRRQLVHAQHAQIRQADRGPAPRSGPDALADEQELVRFRGPPLPADGAHFHFALDGEQHVRGPARFERRHVLGAQRSAPGQGQGAEEGSEIVIQAIAAHCRLSSPLG